MMLTRFSSQFQVVGTRDRLSKPPNLGSLFISFQLFLYAINFFVEFLHIIVGAEFESERELAAEK